MKLNGLVYIAVAGLIILAGVVIWQAHKEPVVAADPALLQSLQDSVKTAKAQLQAAGAMIATLRQTGAAKDGKLKVSAATIADLTARLGKVQGGGPSTPGEGEWKVYQDKFLTAFYCPDTLTYALNSRPIKISLVEGLDNTWAAYAWDIWADCPAVIDSLNIQRNRDFQPPRPWYKKLGTVAKYIGVGAAAGGLGYMAGRIF